MKKVLSVLIVAVMFLLSFASLNTAAETNNNQIAPANETLNETHNGSIQVTFGKNSYFDIDYYYDEAFTQPIDTTNCWLNKGDSIYVSGIKTKNAKSNLYFFSEFRFAKYNKEDKRDGVVETSTETEGKIYTLPIDFDGNGISVLPIGTYKDREIELDSYYFNSDGNPVEFTDKMWRINEGGELFANGTQTISPVESYTLSFDYSPYNDSYYFVKSTPECFYHKGTDSEVVFSKINSNEETQKFRVEMHRFINLQIKDTEHQWLVDDWFDKGAIIKIEKNSETLDEYQKGSSEFKRKEINIPKLKIGDTVSITVGKKYKLVSPNLCLTNPIPVEEGYQYTIQFPENNEYKYQIELSTRNTDSEGKFEPLVIPNGTFSLSYENGGTIKQGDELPAEGQRVVLEIAGNDGFYVSGNDTENGTYKKTMSFSDYQKNIDSIIAEHPVYRYITIQLPEKDAHGTCTYQLDGTKVESKAENIRDNQELKMTYVLNEDDRDKYEIERTNAFARVLSWFTGSSKITVEIPITQDLNGMELDISDYITLKEKE